MKTLLAIDGGGLFGIGVANWMPKLENWKFDYYAGTSVGSILAACYATGMEPLEIIDIITVGNARYTSYGVRHLLDEEKRYLRVSPDTLPSGSLDDFDLVPKIKKVWEEWDHLEALEFLKNHE